MNCGPATGAGPTHHSAIAGTIRKTRSDCMSSAKGLSREERGAVEFTF